MQRILILHKTTKNKTGLKKGFNRKLTSYLEFKQMILRACIPQITMLSSILDNACSDT